MHRREEGRPVTRIVVAPQILDGAAIAELDGLITSGWRELVLDLSGVHEVDEEAVPMLEWLAQRSENAGGSLSVTARRAPGGARTFRPLRSGYLCGVLAVHPALDRATLHRLASGVGGAAPR